MPRKRNPVTDMPVASSGEMSAAQPEVSVSAPQPPQDYGLPLGLPDALNVEMPDIHGLAESAVGFTPNASLPRVSESQRNEDALIFQEQRFAAENLRDSIGVAHSYVSAGVAATKLGKELIRYQTGVADIRTALIQLDRANVKTATAGAELQADRLTLDYATNRLAPMAEEYAHRLSENVARAERARLKAEQFAHQTATLLQELNTAHA